MTAEIPLTARGNTADQSLESLEGPRGPKLAIHRPTRSDHRLPLAVQLARVMPPRRSRLRPPHRSDEHRELGRLPLPAFSSPGL